MEILLHLNRQKLKNFKLTILIFYNLPFTVKQPVLKPSIVKTLCISWLLLCFGNLLHSQNLPGDFINHHQIFSVENGLSSREVFCGLQDKKGFLWFGTRNGLDRFDGESFKHFNKPGGGVTDNKIVQLALDFQNRLFILYGSSSSGRLGSKVGVMDLNNFESVDLKAAFPALPFKQERVYWLDMDQGDHSIYFLVEKPFQLWRLSKKGFEMVCDMPEWDENLKLGQETAGNNFKFEAYRNQFFDSECVLYLSGNAPLYIINSKGKSQINEGGLIPLGISPNHKIYVKIKDDFYVIDQNGKEKSPYSFINPFISNYTTSAFRSNVGQHEMLFFNQQFGLFVSDYKSVTKLLEPIAINDVGFKVNSFFKDQRGEYWICTNECIFKVHNESRRFFNLYNNVLLPGLTTYEVRGLFEAGNGNLLANISQSVCYKKGNSSIDLKSPEINILYGIVRHNGHIYTAGKKLFKVNAGFTSMEQMQGISGVGDIWTLDSLNSDELLIGCEKGFGKYSISKKRFSQMVPVNHGFPASQVVFRFTRRKDGTHLVVAQNGLYIVDFKNNKVLHFYGQGEGLSVLKFPSQTIHDAYESKDGLFWIASYGNGLFSYNPVSYESNQYNILNGFESDVLYRIEPDKFSNIWVSSDLGLVKFNLKSHKTQKYTVLNGITHNEFNRGSSCSGKNGVLYFGTINGVTKFNPADFVKDTSIYHAKIELVSFQKYHPGSDGLDDQTELVLKSNEIIVYPRDHFFIMKFRLLDFESEHTQYAYFIEGVDPTWNLISENQLRLGGLPYGEFVIRVKGRSGNGNWSGNELRFKLSVKKPFFRKAWFVIMLILTILFIIFLIYKLRTRQHEKLRVLLEKTVEERTEELQKTLGEKELLIKEIHHRVKNNLQVIIGLMDLQSMDIGNAKVKSLFEESKSRIHSIALVHYKLFQSHNISAIEISNFINDLYFQVATSFKKPKQIVNFEMDVPKTFIDIDTAVPFGVVINELLTNSFKYAFKDHIPSNIYIKLTKISESKFIFFYKDDGKGLPENINFEKLETLGLRLIKLLSKQIGGKVTYNYNLGAEFEIEFKPRVPIPQ